MKTKIILPLMLALVTIFSSCKKSDDPVPSSTTANPTANGGSYFPTTTGNTWNYQSDNGDYSVRATGNTQQYNGRAYQILEQTEAGSSPVNGYIARDANKYLTYSAVASSVLELKLIDLDLPIGNTWVTKFASNQYTDVTYTFKVTGTGLTRTVNGVQYADVISIQLNTTCQLSAAAIALYSPYFTPAEIQEFQDEVAENNFVQTTYYANNIGMIEQVSATNGLNVQLVSKTIN